MAGNLSTPAADSYCQIDHQSGHTVTQLTDPANSRIGEAWLAKGYV
jgi:hypothetical protein